MGAIGDYIHLTYDGYAGVRHSKEPYLYEAGRVIKQHRNIFNRDVNNMTSKLIFKLQNEIDNKLNLINAIQSEYQGTKEYPAIDEISQELLQLVAEKMKSR